MIQLTIICSDIYSGERTIAGRLNLNNFNDFLDFAKNTNSWANGGHEFWDGRIVNTFMIEDKNIQDFCDEQDVDELPHVQFLNDDSFIVIKHIEEEENDIRKNENGSDGVDKKER
jgi:hypothetical protein